MIEEASDDNPALTDPAVPPKGPDPGNASPNMPNPPPPYTFGVLALGAEGGTAE